MDAAAPAAEARGGGPDGSLASLAAALGRAGLPDAERAAPGAHRLGLRAGHVEYLHDTAVRHRLPPAEVMRDALIALRVGARPADLARAADNDWPPGEVLRALFRDVAGSRADPWRDDRLLARDGAVGDLLAMACDLTGLPDPELAAVGCRHALLMAARALDAGLGPDGFLDWARALSAPDGTAAGIGQALGDWADAAPGARGSAERDAWWSRARPWAEAGIGPAEASRLIRLPDGDPALPSEQDLAAMRGLRPAPGRR